MSERSGIPESSTQDDGRHHAVETGTSREAQAQPLAPSRPDEANVTSLLLERAAATPERAVYARRVGASWESVTADGFLEQVRWLARGLIAGGLGLGDRVAILSSSTYAWSLADFAIWYAGGVTVPIYETDSQSQIEWILRDSGASRVFVAPELEATAVRVIDGSPELAERLIAVTSLVVEGEGSTLSSLAGPGQGVSDAELERHRSAARRDSPATVVYTSGTTGRPKGCLITHGNFLALADNLIPHLPDPLGAPDPRTVIFLPLAHVLAHAVQVVCLAAGVTVAYSSPSQLLSTLRSFRPTFLLGVPRIFEKVYSGAYEQALASGRSGLFVRAAAVARDYSAALDDAAAGRGEGPTRGLRLKHAVFDRLVFGRIRAIFGGALTTTVCGGGPLSPQLAHFFRGIGVRLIEGYGLTETTGPCTVNTADAVRVGTVGRPVPGTSIRIADDGEILVRGVGVFAGYTGEASDGEPTLDADGFFPTGDLGTLDDDGFLTITGRKKDVLVTAGGKNVAPEPLEERVRESPLVAHAIVVGDGRPFVGALVILDPEGLATWCGERGRALAVATAGSDPEVLAVIQQAVDAANASVSRAESIRKFVVVDLDPTVASGQLTPSLKLRRDVVLAACGDAIESLYS